MAEPEVVLAQGGLSARDHLLQLPHVSQEELGSREDKHLPGTTQPLSTRMLKESGMACVLCDCSVGEGDTPKNNWGECSNFCSR